MSCFAPRADLRVGAVVQRASEHRWPRWSKSGQGDRVWLTEVLRRGPGMSSSGRSHPSCNWSDEKKQPEVQRAGYRRSRQVEWLVRRSCGNSLHVFLQECSGQCGWSRVNREVRGVGCQGVSVYADNSYYLPTRALRMHDLCVLQKLWQEEMIISFGRWLKFREVMWYV